MVLDVWRQRCLQAESAHSPAICRTRNNFAKQPHTCSCCLPSQEEPNKHHSGWKFRVSPYEDQESTTIQKFLLRLIRARVFLVCVNKEEVERRGKGLRAICTYACEHIDPNLKKEDQ